VGPMQTACQGVPYFGRRLVIVAITHNETQPPTCDVTVAYSDFAFTGALALPRYLNAPEGWTGTVIQDSSSTACPYLWTVTQVPYDSIALLDVTSQCTSGHVVLQVPVGAIDCSTLTAPPITVLAAGYNCLSFQWTPSTLFEGGYFYALYRLRDQQQTLLVDGYLDPGSDGVDFVDLDADTQYKLVLFGVCWDLTVTSTPASIDTATAPMPALGQTYDVPSKVYDPDTDTYTITIEYTAYVSVTDISIYEHSVTPPATVTIVNSPPGSNTWVIAGMPPDTTLVMYVSAVADAELCFVLSAATPAADTISNRLKPLSTPTPPVCGAIETLSVAPGATCAHASWTSPPANTGLGIQWRIAESPGISGTVHQGLTLTIPGLTAGSAYTLSAVLQCTASTYGPRSTVPFTTAPVTDPVLLPFQAPPWTLTFTNDVCVLFCPSTQVRCCDKSSLKLYPVGGAGFIPGSYRPDGSGWDFRLSGLAPGLTYTYHLTATPQTGCGCTCTCSSVPPTPILVTVDVPANPCASTATQNLAVAYPVQPTCATVTWSPNSIFTGGYVWGLTGGTGGATGGTVGPTTSSLALTAPVLAPGTEYHFRVAGLCAEGVTGAYTSVNFTTPAAAQPSLPVPQASDIVISYLPAGAASFVLRYTEGVCVSLTDMALTTTDGGVTILKKTSSPPTWTVTGLAQGDTYSFMLTSLGSTAGCGSCAPVSGTVDSPLFQVAIPTAGPTGTAPYSLAITNYGGPPAALINIAVTGPTGASILTGGGTVDELGSYANQKALNATYGELIAQGLLLYSAKTPLGPPLNYCLPIQALYLGNTSDPAATGNCIAHLKDDAYEATLNYNYTNYVAGTTSDIPAAPIVEVLLAIANFNYRMLQEGEPTKAVQLAFTNYGSKNANEEWWFNVVCETDGQLSVAPPSNPKSLPSLVTGVTYDGSGADTDKTAGYNCMERWFMHLAIINQSLRQAIYNGSVTYNSTTLTLHDPAFYSNPQLFQVSAITCDSEGNGFANTGPPVIAGGTPAEFNFTMKCLWNKWVNQATALPTGPYPSWWGPDGAGNLVVTHSRAFMPVAFILPCKMSMTTPGLLPGMSSADLNSPDFDAVNAIFHEIYDTANKPPFYYLDAQSFRVQSPACTSGTSPSATGASFNEAVRFAALEDQRYIAYPEQYGSYFGMWDNLGTPAPTCASVLKTQGDELILFGCTGASGCGGGVTCFQDSSVVYGPLMNTSQFNPWDSAKNVAQWLPGDAGDDKDAMALGWALESSRYDLFNGLWAAQAATGGRPIDYHAVLQSGVTGGTGPDGGAIYRDLSLGLRPTAAGVVSGFLLGPSGGTAAIPGQIFMLSCECALFVNSMGVRGSARNGLGPSSLSQEDYLTFTAPASTWPGWTGMKGQWWGPGTQAANANLLQQWSVNQVLLGYGTTNVVTATNGSEDNFGVFADRNIIANAWDAMARDLTNGITESYDSAFGSQKPCLGCYELAFMPLAWFDPTVVSHFTPQGTTGGVP